MADFSSAEPLDSRRLHVWEDDGGLPAFPAATADVSVILLGAAEGIQAVQAPRPEIDDRMVPAPLGRPAEVARRLDAAVLVSPATQDSDHSTVAQGRSTRFAIDTGQKRFSDCAAAGDWAIVQRPPHEHGHVGHHEHGHVGHKERWEQVTCQPSGAGPSADVPSDSPARRGRQADAACWIVERSWRVPDRSRPRCRWSLRPQSYSGALGRRAPRWHEHGHW